MKLTILLLILVLSANAAERNISENPYERNFALLASSAHGLPGLDKDIAYVDTILKSSENGFETKYLVKGAATVAKVEEELAKGAEYVDSRGTFMFFFTGHGASNVIMLEDTTISITKMRAAMMKGREKWGPLVRLSFMIDACHSGSLLDPLRQVLPLSQLDTPETMSLNLADSIVNGLSPTTREELPLYQSLFAFVSARPNETCEAGSNGSEFTVAMKNAYAKGATQKWAVSEFVKETEKNMQGSHPVARFVPASLASEPLVTNW